jgi:hypothetical protein
VLGLLHARQGDAAPARAVAAAAGGEAIGGFSCHAKPDCFCHGWAVVHSNRGHEHDLIALRLSPDAEVPEPAVPLFGSGNEAADHGQREIETPGIEARKAVTVLRRYPRIRDAEEDR